MKVKIVGYNNWFNLDENGTVDVFNFIIYKWGVAICVFNLGFSMWIRKKGE